MNQGMYVAASGAVALERKMDVVTNNLANINTAGFKADQMVFESYLKAGDTGKPEDAQRLSEYVVASEVSTDFSQGAFRETGNELDLAIKGDGFFAVMTHAGERYTRTGSFSVNANGDLVTVDGHLALNDRDMPINVGDGVVQVDEEGSVWVLGGFPPNLNPSGSVRSSSHGEYMGRLKIVDFADTKNLVKEGGRLYRSGQDDLPVPARSGKVMQGYQETSNVNMIGEMTEIIKSQRAYESYQKAIRESDSMTTQLIAQVGRP